MPNEVFIEMLGTLVEKRSGLVFLILFDRCYHRDGHRVSATIAEIARWCGMDERPVAACIAELREKGLLRRVKKGVNRSHINKPRWHVPLCDIDLSEGHWVAVPRFLITRYCRRFPGAVLLLFLLNYQHLHWINKSWPGVATLSQRTGWSPSRVRDALRIMGHEHVWLKQGINLPWPLRITYAKQGTRRHFQVRAVLYQMTGLKNRRRHIMVVSKEFRKRFKVRSTLVGDAITV